MDAEHRHDLQRNELEDYTTKLKPFLSRYGRTIGLVAVALLLLLISVSLWSTRSRAAGEAGWGGYFAARDAPGFESVAELDAGTNAAVWARLAAGQRYLTAAAGESYTDRAAADDDFESARTNFRAVLDDADAPAVAKAKALYGMAAVEEATGGGDLGPATARLEELVADYPDSPLAPVAESRLKELRDPSIAPFLAWLDTQDPTPEDLARPLDGPADAPDAGPQLPARPEGLERIGSSDSPEPPAADEPAAGDGDGAAAVIPPEAVTPPTDAPPTNTLSAEDDTPPEPVAGAGSE